MVSKIKKQLAYKNLYKVKDNVNFDIEMQEKIKPYMELKNIISSEKKDIKKEKKEIKYPSQSKVLLIFLFINFTLLELFIGYVTIQTLYIALSVGLMPDFTPLVTLISLVAGETISYGIYAVKAKAENTKNGIIYETTMYNLEQERNEDNTFG